MAVIVNFYSQLTLAYVTSLYYTSAPYLKNIWTSLLVITFLRVTVVENFFLLYCIVTSMAFENWIVNIACCNITVDSIQLFLVWIRSGLTASVKQQQQLVTVREIIELLFSIQFTYDDLKKATLNCYNLEWGRTLLCFTAKLAKLTFWSRLLFWKSSNLTALEEKNFLMIRTWFVPHWDVQEKTLDTSRYCR